MGNYCQPFHIPITVFSTSVPKWYTLEMFCLIQLRLFSTVVDCGSPPPLENATISCQSGTVLGSNVTYVCNEDNSIKQHTCQASGNWSNEDIRCCKFS